MVSNLTNDISLLNSAIDNIVYPADTTPSYTNLQAGLNMAKQLFSEEKNNKYLIILTDGVPNVILNRNEVQFDEETISNTKSELASISSSGIELITMLTGIKNGDASLDSNYTYNEYINEIFGTPTNPTAGNFYYIDDSKIEETISTDIYNSLVPISKTYKDITIIDYFPSEIINNFDFAYVSQTNIGTISTKVDTDTNSITWIIPKLISGETATVQYKLKLKENFDSNIVDKVLNTNKKVDLNYTDLDDKNQTKTSDISPKLKLTVPNTAPDITESPKILPDAGKITLITFGVLVVEFSIFSITKFLILNNKMK